MRKSVAAIIAACGLLVAAKTAVAQTASMKEVLTIAVSSYDELMADAEYLAQLGGQPGISQIAEMMLAGFTQNQGLAGLDKSRPWGAVVLTDDVAFVPYIFLPVTDVNQLLTALAGVVGPATEQGGAYQITAGPAPVFVKQQGDWAFVAQDPSKLDDLPSNPLEWLGGLEENYDLGIRASVNNIPVGFRQQALMFMKMGMGSAMQRNPDETDAQFQIRQQIMTGQMEQMEQAVNQLESMTIGLSIDTESKGIYLDAQSTAVEGTDLAEQLAASSEVATKFAGLLAPEAAVQFNATSVIREQDVQQVTAMLDPLRAAMMQAVDEEADLPNEAMRTKIKSLAGAVFDIYADSVKSGTIDVAGSLSLGHGDLSMLMGAHVADGASVEAVLREAVEMAEQDPNFPGFNFNAAEHAGVAMHTLTVPVPSNEAEARQILGDTLEVVVGTGPQSVYMAMGSGCVAKLSDAIDASTAAAAADVPPVQVIVTLGPIFEFASKVEDDEEVQAIATALSGMKGRDRVVMTVTNIDRGQRARLAIEEGVLNGIGEAVKASQQ